VADTTITVAARLDRLPASRHTRRLITLISLGGWFEFYDLFFTAYVAIGLFKAGLFKPPSPTASIFDPQGFASFIAALFAGLFVGTLAFSWLSDRFGRRSIFTFALLWYSVGAFIMAFQTTPEGIDLWRFIAGIGLGVELVNVDTYVSELVPKERRGPAFAYNQFVMFTAVPVVAFLSWLLVPVKVFGLDGWRIVVIIGSIGALVIWWIRRSLPESPRWLAQHGRIAEAEQIVGDLEQKISADNGGKLPPPEAVAGEAERKSGAWSEMWNATYRGRTAMLVVYNLFQTVGYYGFANWAPTFLISQGIDTTKSLAYTFIIAVANPIAPLIGIFFADRFERKWQIAWSAIGIAVFGLT
jgi:MFS transporter, putative metabolite:H+ symporter